VYIKPNKSNVAAVVDGLLLKEKEGEVREEGIRIGIN
jgi:hypothetical protein